MSELKIIEATYFVPEIGEDRGTNVIEQLSAEIIDGVLIYNGLYNNIFPDNFKGYYKRLKIKAEYKKKLFTRYYNENEKINLLNDLGKNKEQMWWEQTWIQIFFILGALAGIISFFISVI